MIFQISSVGDFSDFNWVTLLGESAVQKNFRGTNQLFRPSSSGRLLDAIQKRNEKNPSFFLMDGLYHGKPYEQMDDLGVPLFLETPIYTR